jgi:hypothetical protein
LNAPRKKSRIWLWVVAAFVVQLLAWGFWLTLASNHPVEDVPLATRPGLK